MTYAQIYRLTKQANTQQTADTTLQDAFNLGGQMGGAAAYHNKSASLWSDARQHYTK
jgi:hypothetical protein